MKKKIVYLPIEIKSREYLGKLLLATFLAEENYAVVLGERSLMNRILHLIPNGIYFEKGSGYTGESRFIFNKNLGNKIVEFLSLIHI